MNHSEFLKQLSQLDIHDVIDAYIEAKTGKYVSAADILPVETYEVVMDIPRYINNYNTKHLLRGLSEE